MVHIDGEIVSNCCIRFHRLLHFSKHLLRRASCRNIAIRMTQTEDDLFISIADSGIGIAPEQLEYVFERFYKTDSSRNRNISGNGLGLAIAKKIVTLHQGSIAMESQ